MIRVKNLGEELLDWGVGGTQSTGVKKSWLAPYDGVIKALYGKVRAAGTTGTQVNDIKKNGTSIFSGATKVDFASAATAATYGALTTDPTTFVKGDILTLDITAVHTTPAADLGLLVTVARGNQARPAAMLTDKVSESD